MIVLGYVTWDYTTGLYDAGGYAESMAAGGMAEGEGDEEGAEDDQHQDMAEMADD